MTVSSLWTQTADDDGGHVLLHHSFDRDRIRGLALHLAASGDGRAAQPQPDHLGADQPRRLADLGVPAFAGPGER